MFDQIYKVIKDNKITCLKFNKTYILVRPKFSTATLDQKLNFRDNLNRFREFALGNSSIVAVERRNMTSELDMVKDKIGVKNYMNLCDKVEKLYLNFGKI